MPNVYAVMIGFMDGSSQWEEQLAIPDGVDPEACIRELLIDFNELQTKRYGDKAKPRKFISVDMARSTRMCSWTRVNTVTLTDSKGMHNLYRCDECKLTVRTGAMARPGEKECHPERVCTICNKEFASDKNLARHLARKHPEEF